MKCPYCGAKLQEGILYCEKCGGDIHMVPDFEPELENNIQESLKHIAEDVNVGISAEAKDTVSRDSVRRNRRSTHFVPILLGVCAMILALAVVFLGIKIYQYYSYDYQIKKAVSCVSVSKFDHAIGYYNRAIELEPANIELYFNLADVYMQKGNKLEYEYLLRDIIKNPLCSQGQLERAYGKLIVIYSDRKEYDTISEILKASKNEAIMNAYQVYLASPPQFNYEEGYYDKIIPLKLTTGSTGRIYYTTDGSEPDESSLLYTAPILLEDSTTVKAIVINDYGIKSEVVSKKYHVKKVMEAAPQISVISGTYHIPMLIEVTDHPEMEVYYTTDGTVPNLHSKMYTGPIPMPLGKSEFNFVYLKEDGTAGEVANRQYELILNTDLTVDAARELVVECMLDLGKIYHEDGSYSTETTAKYLYEYQYVISIEGQGDFYVIAEILQDAAGVRSKTGSFYGVNINTKKCYKLSTNENNNYALVEILIDSPDEG